MAKRRGPAWALVTKIIASVVFLVTLGWDGPLPAQDSSGDLIGHVVDGSGGATPAAGLKVVNGDARQPCTATHSAIGQEGTGTVWPTVDRDANFSSARLTGNSCRGMLSTLPLGSASENYSFAPLIEITPRYEKPEERAFVKVPQPAGKQESATGGKLPLILMCVAVHAAVTWDAWTTNDVFHHQFPAGYHPVEEDPIMRPFAGTGAMYPLANLAFAVPFDLLLYETRHHHGPKVARVLAYGAASTWVGIELRQSILNLQEEHIGSGR